VPALGLGALVLVSWQLRFVDRGTVPPLDLYLYFYPVYEATYRRIAAGIVPLWNPYQLCGIPWLATLQGGTFYPLHALYLVLPLHLGLAMSHAFHLLLVGFSTLAFARRAGLGVAAAMLAAVLFTLRGLIPVSMGSTNYLEAAAWLPLGALAVLELTRRPALGPVVLIAVATALSFLAGYPQPSTYMLVAWGTLVVALLVGARARPAAWLRAGVLFAAAVTLGTVAAAAQLAPGLELLRHSGHRDLTPEAMAPYGPLSPAVGILTTASITGSPFAFGVTALALVAVAPFTRRQRTLAWWTLGLAIFGAIVALGPVTPLFRVYQALPILGSFRFPDRMLGVTDFALAMAAAVGLDALARGARAHRTIAIAGALLVFVLGWLGHAPPPYLPQVGWFALATVGLLLLALVWRRANPALLATALVVLVTSEISLAPWDHLVTYSGGVLQRYDQYETELRELAARAGSDRAWVYGDIGKLQPSLALKLATRYGLRVIDDYEPLHLRRQAEYFTFFTEGTPELHRPPWLFNGDLSTIASPPGVAAPATRRRLLDLAATRYVLVPAGLPGARPALRQFLTDGGFVPEPFVGEKLLLFGNPRALPRAYVVYRTRPAPGAAELLRALSAEHFDALAESYIEGAPGFTPAPDAPARGTAARIALDDEHVVEVEATLARPGLVVLADSFYPGWRATVDGQPAPILATNHLFRGVPAPTGRHRIRFEYRPLSVMLGAAGTAVGWVVIGALAVVARWRR
jgi:hypothetical protein